MSDELTGQLTRWSWHIEMKWRRYKTTEIADKNPEAERLVAWLDMSCQPGIDVFIKEAIFRCQSRSRLMVKVKRSLVNSPYELIISSTLSLLDSTCVASQRNKENKLYFYIQVFIIFFIKSIYSVLAGRKTPVAVYNTYWRDTNWYSLSVFLLERVHQGVIALKGYSTFLKALGLDSPHQMQFSVKSKTLVGRGYYPSTEKQSA